VKTSDYESFATWIEGYYGHKPVKYGQKPNLKTTHKYGYTILDKKGNVVKTVDRTNPNRKWDGYDEFFVTREECIQAARDRAFTTFALLKDGEWYEKGRMGWFALVSNEKVQGDWNKEFNSIIDGLSDDTLLTVCDCHI
jgi:hypothetical protein